MFGWVISGPAVRPPLSVHALHTRVNSTTGRDDTDSLLRRFWELEEVAASPLSSPEDATCEEHFICTHRRSADGRYVVRLPCRDGPSIDPRWRVTCAHCSLLVILESPSGKGCVSESRIHRVLARVRKPRSQDPSGPETPLQRNRTGLSTSPSEHSRRS